MSNVVNIKEKDFKHVTYIEDGDLGVSTRCRALSIYRLNKNEFEIVTSSGPSFVLDRETLAEFLHVSCVFVDSETRYKPEMDMVGCNYE